MNSVNEDVPAALADPETAASALRERVYSALIGLSTVLILMDEADTISARTAASSLAITMGGLWAASIVADLVSHSAVAGQQVDRGHLRRSVLIAGQAIEITIIPVAVIALAGTGIWTVGTSLIIAETILVVTLLGVSAWAVRRSTFPFWQRILIVAGEAALAVLVIVIKLIAH